MVLPDVVQTWSLANSKQPWWNEKESDMMETLLLQNVSWRLVLTSTSNNTRGQTMFVSFQLIWLWLAWCVLLWRYRRCCYGTIILNFLGQPNRNASWCLSIYISIIIRPHSLCEYRRMDLNIFFIWCIFAVRSRFLDIIRISESWGDDDRSLGF